MYVVESGSSGLEWFNECYLSAPLKEGNWAGFADCRAVIVSFENLFNMTEQQITHVKEQWPWH